MSFTGYTSQTLKLDDAQYIDVKLEVANNELDVAIVQAYGTTTRRLGTGNIARVTAAEIERQHGNESTFSSTRQSGRFGY